MNKIECYIFLEDYTPLIFYCIRVFLYVLLCTVMVF